MAIIDLDEFRRHEKEKLISCQTHPYDDLLIWNYTQRAQFDNVWDDVTTIARGLITDSDGVIKYRPFRKFFNLGQREETMIRNLPAEIPEIRCKEDGSLGILYRSASGLHVATRGSFFSDQATWASNWMQIHGPRDEYLLEGYTYLWEIVYRNNRIVVDYGGREELILLAIIRTEDGIEDVDIDREALSLGVSRAPVMHGYSLESAMNTTDGIENIEGFVAKYSNGLRVKFKTAEYCRLHKVLTGLSNIGIWEILRSGRSLTDVLDRVPDEFFEWGKQTQAQLELAHKKIAADAQVAFAAVRELPDRKSQALRLQADYRDIQGLVFGLLDNKDIQDMIWKRLRPAFDRPFRKDIDV